MAWLGELGLEIVRRREENARLSALITELEGKCQQPAPELLQRVRSTVSRSLCLSTSLCRAEEVMPLHPAPTFPGQDRRIGESKPQEVLMRFLEFRRARGHTGE
ncbi:tripartite motif-containing protein 15-like [Alligator sinensis]|uniref:Tripartite motif-containing protein 15-like n=1 Tax=Alligator sinensis TaxID=38654 RepID=A0A3Q0FKJ2_ALLSI|nr:tripartite motif-containing protein 15-like [Alligator sinensis]